MFNQRNALFAGTLALVFGATVPLAQADEQNQNMEQQDHVEEQNQEEMTPENFADGASAINSGELNAAEMALDKDDISPDTRQLAERLQKDHTEVQDKLKSIAQNKDLDLSSTANMTALTGAPRLMVQDGSSFDASFADLQVEAHEEAVAFSKRASEMLDDAELKEFADEALPGLEEHLDMARACSRGDTDQASARHRLADMVRQPAYDQAWMTTKGVRA
ncbi:DUF4142 domain-containing protein [Kushneria indalinina]|uniref:Putative outer membrane protein n=1 Tax=Kushneria indalinina DSM 14324 TaxID=1122140 RepID=A0A3D9DXX4_9GAMM|nr:DUF4142 domain-containing protein [Kushneria indalinina]REC95613.1 putative outer membrane protein [Kushneria indalinina DSM 14324]